MNERMSPVLRYDPALGSSPAVRAALVWAYDLAPVKKEDGPSPSISRIIDAVRAAGDAYLKPERKAAVRDMLRHGAYKPSGRAKPSSEYLLAAALGGEFPIVNGPADANNAASLAYGYPASVFDLGKTGPELLLRRGAAGDSYVFNASGQTIDLEDLLCVWRRNEAGLWAACGNPVKDAMDTKVFEDCRSVVAVIYAPACESAAGLAACAELLEKLFRAECGAADAGHAVVEAGAPC